ncbi:hypothetical protein CTM58_01595 [Prevotella intermedia]|uniref:Uncharacterized protein n=1 Tax=Prevotella intermedia TaxID=28131 RepID=A0A2M8TSI4_PREIN|nr:hypothetical protein CTM58_01595 [Prevotella intermedia]
MLSVYYKTYCFAFQKRRFCTVKAAVLHRKTAAFATPKRGYYFLTKLSLQNQGKIGRCFCGIKVLSDSNNSLYEVLVGTVFFM